MTEILTDSQKDKQSEILFTYLEEELESIGVEAVFAELFTQVEKQLNDV